MEEVSQELTYKGKIILPEFRICSDILCAIIFVLSILGFIGFTVFSFVEGNINEVFYSLDSDGFYCGVDERIDYPYMYRPTPHGDGLYYQVCVKDCPEHWQQAVECYSNSYVPDCDFWNLEKAQDFYSNVTQINQNISESLPFTYPSRKE